MSIVASEINPVVSKIPPHNGSNGFLLRIPHTLSEFRRWALSDEVPEKLPLAFINGEVYIDMSKEVIGSHSLVKTECGRGLANLNEEVDFGHVFINGVLLTNEVAKVSNNPDLLAVSFRALKSGRVRYIERNERIVEIEGSPDMFMEIVSDSSVKKDLEDLRDAYHRAEIREYWLVDARGEDIFFQILQRRKSGYVPSAVVDGWHKSRVWEQSFRLTRKPDRAGVWKYKLEWRPN